MSYDDVEKELTDSLSSLTELRDGPVNLEDRELKLLIVPASARNAPFVLPDGKGFFVLALRRSRAHLIATPTRMITLIADKVMAAIVPALFAPMELTAAKPVWDRITSVN